MNTFNVLVRVKSQYLFYWGRPKSISISDSLISKKYMVFLLKPYIYIRTASGPMMVYICVILFQILGNVVPNQIEALNIPTPNSFSTI